jgi:hypothetical protein
LVGKDFEALAERGVVAAGLVGIDERPSCVDLADDRAAWSILAEVGTAGWGEDVLAVCDSDPDPDGREKAFAVAPIDERAAAGGGTGLCGQAGDQRVPFVRRD